jgi:hypothetical protein
MTCIECGQEYSLRTYCSGCLIELLNNNGRRVAIEELEKLIRDFDFVTNNGKYVSGWNGGLKELILERIKELEDARK